MTKDIMDVKGVAEYLALSPTTVYRMLTSGEIPNVKVGGQYRFPKGVIDDWLSGALSLPDKPMSTKSTRITTITRQPKTKEKAKSRTKTVVRTEDEIIGHLLAAQASGSMDERSKAKRLMLEQISAMDMGYLAAKAKSAGVLEEAIAVQNELIKEASG